MSLQIVGFAVIILAALLVIGKLIRLKIPILQKLFLPTSLIGGFLALLLGPEVLGRLTTDGFLDAGFFTKDMVEVWAGLPELLINIVFACLFIGFILPKPRKMWRVGGPQIALGYTISWAQYVVGILLTLTVLTPFFGLSPAAGALIEISFVGGHGTAAGLQSTFEELGFSEGYDLAIGLATVGILSGVVIGMIMVNWAARKGKSQTLRHPDEISFEQRTGIINKEHRKSAGTKTTSPLSIEPFAFHLGLIGISIFIGYVLLEAFVWLEDATYGSALDIYLFEYVPLFPFAMIGGIIVQIFLSRFDYHELVDRDTINTIQGVALDFLIISAMASLSLQVIGANIIPFILLSIVGIALNIFLFLYLGPKMIPSYWFERGIGDFGQSTGVAATGIMLMRIVDPENKSPALNAFGYKQILFEPMVGGGLVTAASVPFIIQFGAIPVLIAVILLTTAFWLLGTLYFGKRKEFD
ncbi:MULTISPECIES: sodium/glutamate symporter [Oceanobacillus]|uniref:Sodium/glutamate symporter n=1 Tax=Oceanobacillus aidingensis TaxID=645964 RepID=A0ABV9JZB7_9BACI|nr:sodium/glutamate symporter [Oceanobacillus oncorhynchi]MDM8099881.1 sodium/glutamate symporter [Oceanobacillus oncorhynchi]